MRRAYFALACVVVLVLGLWVIEQRWQIRDTSGSPGILLDTWTGYCWKYVRGQWIALPRRPRDYVLPPSDPQDSIK